MADIFQRAWGNYAALLEFLVNGGSEDDTFNEQKGLVQLFSFATLLPYTLTKDNYDNFLLMNAVDFASGGKIDVNTDAQVENSSQLEHVVELTQSYEYFLNRLDELISEALDPRDEPQYEALQQRVQASQQKLDNYQRFVDARWSDYIAANPGIPPEELRARRVIFERENGHTMELKRLKTFVSQDNARLNAWLRSKLKPELHALLKARQFFDDPGYQIDLPIAADHDDPAKLHYWRAFHMQLPKLNLDEFIANDSKIDRKFETKETHYKRVEEKWKVSVRGRWGIFSGGGSAERRTLEELSTRTEFSATVSFKRFEEVDIYRDQWFQPLLFDTLGQDFPEFWGPGGLLATYPRTLIVARGLRVAVKITDEYRRTLEKFFSAGGSVRFGPFFSGGGNYSKNEKYLDYLFTEDGFELFDSDRTIRLLGARVARPNWDQKLADDHYAAPTAEEMNSAAAVLAKIKAEQEKARDHSAPGRPRAGSAPRER